MTIRPRGERRDLGAAKPVLVVGAAPSRSGGDLSASPAGTGAGSRLAIYSGRGQEELGKVFEFVNLLPEWPGQAESPKWDEMPSKHSWDVGQRAALLFADLHERPRRKVIGLGGWVKDCLTYWWTPLSADVPLLEWTPGPGGALLAWSAHPSGTSMWWNDPANRASGERFWHEAASFAENSLRLPKVKVKLSTRTSWLVEVVSRYGPDAEHWPAGCVDWPWVEPPGRPQAHLRGNGVPAAHLVLDLVSGRRPSLAHQALHSCDRGDHCVNAAHLRWGTELENRLDQSARSRGDIGRVGLDKARAVRAQLEEISKREGVPMDAISRIASGKSWAEDNWKTTGETT